MCKCENKKAKIDEELTLEDLLCYALGGIIDEICDDIEEEYEIENNISRNIDLDKEIEKVVFSNPATIVFWKDGTKTVTKCVAGDKFNKETGLAMCIIRKLCNNKHFNNVFEKYC